MKLISIDVGLRNLAVAVLEGTTRSDVRITHWEVIDILGEKNGVGRQTCLRCSKPAMWQHKSEGTFTCSKHCPSKKNVTKTSLTKKAVADLQAELTGLKLAASSAKKGDLVNALYTHYKNNTWQKLSGGANIKHASVLNMAPDIAASLLARNAHWKNADKVIFENQPDRRMGQVQAMLHMWFVVHGYSADGISAKHKLDNILRVEDNTATYRGRKKTGVLHAEELVPAQYLPFFRSHKKKDDLADCFLQGLWYMEHH